MDNRTFKDYCGSYFFDKEETFGNETLVLSNCFRQSVLVFVPVLFLWTALPLQIYFLYSSKALRLPWTWFLVMKLYGMVILICVTAVEWMFAVYARSMDEPNIAPVHVIAPTLLFLAMITLVLLMIMCRERGLITSGVIFLTLLLLAICGAPEFRYQISKTNDKMSVHEKVTQACTFIYYLMIVVELILNAFADRPTEYEAAGKENEKPCPENYASFLNKITFSWFGGLAILGWRRDLTKDDLWVLSDQDCSKTLVKLWDKIWGKKMDKYWRQKQVATRHQESVKSNVNSEEVHIVDGGSQSAKAKSPAPPSIVSTLFVCFWNVLIPSTILQLIHDVLQFASPQLLSALINFASDTSQPLWKGFAYAILLFTVAFVCSLLQHQSNHWMTRMGMNVRTVLISAIFTKCLRLSNSARRKSTVGEIVNLMSVDTEKFMLVTPYIYLLWSAPLQIAMCLYFLWKELGPSIFAGLGSMVLLIPVVACLAHVHHKYQMAQMKLKDDRVKLVTEILNGMKVLKLYAWEKSFEKQVMDIRKEELKLLKKSACLSSIMTALWISAPVLVCIVSFSTFILSDPVNNVLTPQRVFVSLTLFNALSALMMILPMFLVFMVQVSVSNKRIKEFLVSEELSTSTVDKKPNQEEAIKIENGSFSWEKEGGKWKPGLDNINLSIVPGQLVAVVGQVGSGKSSLLSAILGEMEKLKGHVATKGDIAYVPQLAWIQNLTLRDNVTFSRDFDQEFYDQVVKACSLETDFSVLPGGDQTEIGEKGINLSGGQKQRVSLARAVYQNVDIYLLDDPLSAVDAHVGRHIFDHVISNEGLLRGKTRILVTHGLGYLKKVDKIVVLRDGQISEMGTFNELLFRKGAFSELITTYLQEKAQELELEKESVAEEEVGEWAEVLQELEKVDPNARARLTSQLSHDQAGSPKGSLRRLLSTQQSVGGGKKSPPLSPGKGPRKTLLSPQSSVVKSGKEETEKDAKAAAPGTKLISDEETETGHVKWKVYKDYMAALGWGRWVSVVFLALFSGFNVGTVLWLADWSDEGNRNESEALGVSTRLGVYGALGLGQTVTALIAVMVAYYAMAMAAAQLHAGLLRNLMRSPMSFFDVTPLGRIVNRAGKDVDTVDNTLPENFQTWIGCIASVVSTLIIITVGTPLFIVMVVPLGLLYYFIQRFYICTSRQLKRIESVSRSPINSHFQETVTGAVSIRAYSVQERFIEESERRVDVSQAAYYPNIVSNNWLGIRLEFVGNLVVFFAAVFAVTSRFWGNATTAGLVGLAVSSALSITEMLTWAVQMTSNVEANIVAVERIKEYSEMPTEASWETDVKPPSNWPNEGRVDLENYQLRYRPDLELVLKGITCNVASRERIGIVGRTGAGKSSLTLALFRIVEGSGGKIVIDGVDISKIGLHDLRGRLTIIPQDPVLFSGTLRMNLDPFEQYSDQEIWLALEHSHLKNFVAEIPGKLLTKITEGGENLSVGQRQLLCLGRALLRKTKVLILDEATSAVDLETEDLILKTIRAHFSDCTILTIAHRLNTIIDSNRVLVLSDGRVAEFDTPENLLANPSTIFYGMAKDASLIKD